MWKIIALYFLGNKNKVHITIFSSKEALKSGIHAGNLIKKVALLVGGKGGGRAEKAQAGGNNPKEIENAIEKTKIFISEFQNMQKNTNHT